MMHAYQKELSGERVGVVFGSFAPLHQGHLDLMYVAWTINCIYGWVNWSKLSKVKE